METSSVRNVVDGLAMLAGAALFAAGVAVGCGPQGPQGQLADVGDLDMYYEVHGQGRPVVLLHGAFSNIGTDFGALVPGLSEDRQVIGVELQGHGHTPDIDRPLTIPQMAEDTAALLRQLDIERADFVGYSLGGAVALEVARRHPELVGKVVFIGGAGYAPDGMYPELLEMEATLEPEHLAGTPWQQAYATIAPDPNAWSTLITKVVRMDLEWKGYTEEEVRSITAPTLLVIGDSDIVKPEHTAQMFRLLGGGVPGDLAGLPKSQLAVLPGTTHVTVMHKTDWLLSMIPAFLDAP